MTVMYLPVLLYLVITMAVVGAIIFLSMRIGTRKATRQKMLPYECGMDPIGTLEIHFPVKFYVLAMIFIIFDIETVFLYPWGVIFRDLGWFGFVEMLVFTVVLLIGLVYLYRKGALEWD